MMRSIVLFALLAGCTPRVHAEAFVKKNFGFAGPRELAVAGPKDDVHLLRMQLQKHGFTVLEVEELGAASTKYGAEIAGVCHNPLFRSPDADLHIFVVKTESRERVLSVRLGDSNNCPEAYFAEAAAAIARHWPVE